MSVYTLEWFNRRGQRMHGGDLMIRVQLPCRCTGVHSCIPVRELAFGMETIVDCPACEAEYLAGMDREQISDLTPLVMFRVLKGNTPGRHPSRDAAGALRSNP